MSVQSQSIANFHHYVGDIKSQTKKVHYITSNVSV